MVPVCASICPSTTCRLLGADYFANQQSYAQIFTALCGLATTAVAVQPVIVEGKDFVNSVTKERFQILGVE